jgi:hypothetical protein
MSILSLVDSAVYANAERKLRQHNYREALKDLLALATRGHGGAQFRLAMMYFMGEGAPQDYANALHWFLKAAEEGVPAAFSAVGAFFMDGLDPLPRDPSQAARWFLVAAESGDPIGQCLLGKLYLRGEGVALSPSSAFMWLNLAASQGHPDATPLRDKAARELSPDDLAKAQANSTQWYDLFQEASRLSRRTPALTSALSQVREHGLPLEKKLVLPVGSGPLVLTPDFVEHAGMRLHNQDIVQVAYGSLRVTVNLVPVQSATTISLADSKQAFTVDFTRLSIREDTIMAGFHEALAYLTRTVIGPLVERLTATVAEGKSVEIGGLQISLGGIRKNPSYKKGAGDSNAFLRSAFSTPTPTLDKLHLMALPWAAISGIRHVDGCAHLMLDDKLCWASLDLRTTWNAVCLARLLQHPRLAAATGARFQ